MGPPPQAVVRVRAMSELPSLYVLSFATRFASLGGEPPRASWLARVRFRHFPSGRLPRRCAPRNDSCVKGVRLVCYPCSGVIVPTVSDFSAVSHRRRVGWRGTETVRAFSWRVYDCSRFYCGGFLGAEPALASGLARVHSVPFLPRGIPRR